MIGKYKLADGTFSDRYKVGDKFVVTDSVSFSEGSVVELFKNDGSECPKFRLVNGECEWRLCDGGLGAHTNWCRVRAYK